MTTQPIVPGDLFARAQTIAGLRALADFLEDNPAVPVREFGEEYTVFTRRQDDATERAEVDTIAAALGETVTDETEDGGHYTVVQDLRPDHLPRRSHPRSSSGRPRGADELRPGLRPRGRSPDEHRPATRVRPAGRDLPVLPLRRRRTRLPRRDL